MVSLDWPRRQHGIKNASLNGDMVEVYMSSSLGFEDKFGSKVRLKNVLYRLK